MEREQYVCTVCGYNMVGYSPLHCPFCGAGKETFITAEECSQRFHVEETEVNEFLSRLTSVPSLGFKHAAYRIETHDTIFWIDCPSSFDRDVMSMDVIMFTHHHFLGASNLYRNLFMSEVRIHSHDSAFELCRGFTFDTIFTGDFSESGIEAFHIDGHTPGFTCYIYKDVLFLCDYVFYRDGTMRFNPFGPQKETMSGGKTLREIIGQRKLNRVCGYNYVEDFRPWITSFDRLLMNKG